MTVNHFIEKFRSKSDTELERIALNSESYVFTARYAAVTLLKDRNFDSDVIKQVEIENEKRIKAEQRNTINLKEQDQRLIGRIRQIPMKGTGKYGLKNGNELHVKRLNQDRFQVRIDDDFGSQFAPVMICIVKDDSTYSCYPFLYLKPILIFGIGGTTLAVILSLLGYVENDIFTLLLPLMVTVGIQVILLPGVYFTILHFFRNRLREK